MKPVYREAAQKQGSHSGFFSGLVGWLVGLKLARGKKISPTTLSLAFDPLRPVLAKKAQAETGGDVPRDGR